MVSHEEMRKAEAEVKVADRDDQRGRREARARPRPSCDLAEQAARRAHHHRPVRRDRHRADEEPRRERPGQRGGRPPGQPRASSAPAPTSRSTTPTGSRRARSSRSSPGSAATARRPLPIEQKRFRGKITFVDPQIQPVAETAVRIYAEFDNRDIRAPPRPQGDDDHLSELRRRSRRHQQPRRGGPGRAAAAMSRDFPRARGTRID